MKNKLFIAFEGIDGSGKSTQVKRLAAKLTELGHQVYTTFEPTDNPIGKMIRSIFSHQMKADQLTIAGLFVADRLHHLTNEEDGMLKKLEEGFIVITDRYYFSSYAYHGAHVDMDWVIRSNEQSAALLRPDLNIFIDIDPEISMSRLHSNREELELYENIENQKKVKAKYFEAFEKQKAVEKIMMVDGNQSQEAIADFIWKAVEQLL